MKDRIERERMCQGALTETQRLRDGEREKERKEERGEERESECEVES